MMVTRGFGKNQRLFLPNQREAYSLKGNTTMFDTQKLAVFVPASSPVVPPSLGKPVAMKQSKS
ncbi:MAG: hypothetical protein H0U76_22235 [Ktedonobacteraceae bacterium]|nr:hypothetical protein [Ktedonobacteraceae bacterium]